MSTNPSCLKLGFAGTPDFAVPALERLAGSHRICAVFTQPDRRAGRGRALHLSAVKRRALEQGLPVHQPTTFKSPEVIALLRSLELDALIVVAYGQILPAAVLSVPRLGCINIHASLLPRWRGAAPIQRALLAGDSSTGITIMRMAAGLDTGPKLAARSIDIGARDTAKTLHDALAILGADLIMETLDALREGRSHEIAQPADGVTYAEKISKREALIRWSQDSLSIWRQIRAFNPWPVAETRYQGEQLRIWEAEPLDATRPIAGRASEGAPGLVLGASPDGIDVACGQGALRVTRLQLAGRNPLAAREFLKGQRLVGTTLEPT
ncbi:MAG TPA: methionyl-tRNA formyltransferase [Steroidobacteraceae bacterium]|nr:methionyl-tRNA formyltransferase [Steroidobacteraceae bacterium]